MRSCASLHTAGNAVLGAEGMYMLGNFSSHHAYLVGVLQDSARRQKQGHTTAQPMWYYKFLLKVVFMPCFVLHIFLVLFLNIQNCTCLITSLYASIYKKCWSFVIFSKYFVSVWQKISIKVLLNHQMFFNITFMSYEYKV